MPQVYLFSSDLGVALGVNTYQKVSKLILKLWQRYQKQNFNETVEQLQKSHQFVLETEKTDLEKIQQMNKNKKLNLDNDLKKCLGSGDTTDMLRKRQELLKKVNQNNDLNKKEKDEIKKSVVNATNTNFGTKNESNVITIYRQQTGKVVNTPSKFVKKMIYKYVNNETQETCNWYLGGKIDGITEDDIVIEVKNRMYKLFYTMRNYEKPQIQSYLKILDKNKGHLVECLKRKTVTKVNVIEEDFDQQYWDDFVMVRLIKFIDFFHYFLNDINMKTILLLGDEESVEKLFQESLWS